MDLKAMLNEGGGGEEAERRRSPEILKDTQQRPPLHSAYSQAQPPSHAPSSASPSRQQSYTQRRQPTLRVRLLSTPSQNHGAGQYPFAQHPTQSPGSAGSSVTAQHRPYDHAPAGSHPPFARPPSIGYQYAQQHHTPTGLPHSLSHTNSSLSPTPPAHQSPHSVRQSPMSARSLAPGQAHTQYAYQHSQPTTPLGPPSHYPRPAHVPEMQSPFHQRTFSGASNGVIPSGSPAQGQYSAGYVESPGAYFRPPATQRQASDYQSHVERERSISVSPKTQVPARPPSLLSRQSTQHEEARYSGSPNPVMQHSQSNVAQPTFRQTPNSASEVSQPQPQYGKSPDLQSSLSDNQQRPPLPIQHSSSKMGMNHLLTSTREVAPPSNGQYTPADQPSKGMAPPQKQAESSLKRSATETEVEERPSKQRKMRKYKERPVWARLSKHNPDYRREDNVNGAAVQQPKPQQPPPQQATPANIPNGDIPAWRHNPPLDHDLIHARKLLGDKWEKSFNWNTPYPDILRIVQDWLWRQLADLGDVGMDPREGTIEIEAKFGMLIKNGHRYDTDAVNAIVIDPERFHGSFESAMDMHQHKHLNQYLNDCTGTNKQSRNTMDYKHIFETDSFHNLSTIGQQLLPQALQRRRQKSRSPRLRITRDDKLEGHPVKARIVKIPISNLHILNPGNNYDCRISINLEVNLDRPDLDADSLIDYEKDQSQPSEVPRKKDRMAYKHLDVYSIDLTRVDREGMEPTFELELEIDSKILREHMKMMAAGEANGFADLVSGFLENATFLMRQRHVPAATAA